MSTLFLIGNGFDVNCGMNTRYRDVYEGYVKEKTNSEIIRKFKKEISSNLKNWSDFEMEMARYAKNLSDESELLECVRDFAIYMEKHLLNEERILKDKLSNKQICDAIIVEFEKSIASFFSGISHNVNRIMTNRDAGKLINIEVISFNYTDVFDEIFKRALGKNKLRGKKVIHIHGMLGDDPVFGVDNADQIKVNYSLSRKGRRGFIKPIFNEEYDYQRVQQAEALINNANTICVYGISLGESDLSWRNKLIEWLRESESRHLFIYRYSISNAKFRTVSEKIDIEENEKENMLYEWGIDINDPIFEQIHIPCSKNLFNINNVIAKIKYEEMKRKIELGQEFLDQNSKNIVSI